MKRTDYNMDRPDSKIQYTIAFIDKMSTVTKEENGFSI